MPTTAASLQVVVGGDVRGALAGLNKVNQAVSQTGGFLKGAAMNAAGFAAATLGLNVAGGIAENFKAVAFDLNDALDQNAIAFTTLLGSGEKAASFLDNLQKFAAETPFEFTGLAKSSQQFLAVGFSADRIIPLLTDVGNAAAAMGSGTSGVESITRALLQMKGIGVVQMGELNQLSEQGINGLDLLAKHLGKTTAQTRKMVEGGKVSADTFIAAFQTFSSSRFGGMMEKQALTFGGAMSTIFDTVKMGAARVFSPFFELIKEGAVNLSKWLQGAEFAAWIERARSGVAELVQGWGTFAVMAGNIARVQGQGPLDAIMTTAELWLGQRFGPATAASLHTIWDALKAGAGALATNLPKLLTWLGTDAPPLIEKLVAATGKWFDWLGGEGKSELDGLLAKFELWKGWIFREVPQIVTFVKKQFAEITASINTAIDDMIVKLGTIPIPAALGGNPLAGAAAGITAERTKATAANLAAIPGSGYPVDSPGGEFNVNIYNPVVDTDERAEVLRAMLLGTLAHMLDTSQQGGRTIAPLTLVGSR